MEPRWRSLETIRASSEPACSGGLDGTGGEGRDTVVPVESRMSALLHPCLRGFSCVAGLNPDESGRSTPIGLEVAEDVDPGRLSLRAMGERARLMGTILLSMVSEVRIRPASEGDRDEIDDCDVRCAIEGRFARTASANWASMAWLLGNVGERLCVMRD